jgi:hypothetical protein
MLEAVVRSTEARERAAEDDDGFGTHVDVEGDWRFSWRNRQLGTG